MHLIYQAWTFQWVETTQDQYFRLTGLCNEGNMNFEHQAYNNMFLSYDHCCISFTKPAKLIVFEGCFTGAIPGLPNLDNGVDGTRY